MPFGRLTPTPRPAPMGDINMTPLIDVMLVLLVVFMVTAPLMSSSLRLDLPEAGAAQPADTGTALAVAIDAQGRTMLGDAAIDDATLRQRLVEAARHDPATEVQLRADKAVPYGKVAQLIDLVQTAGLSRIGFVAGPASSPAPSARQ